MFSACQNQVVWVTNNQCEPVSHRVLGLGVKKINKEDSCICRSFVLNKPWVFPFTYFCFHLKISMDSSIFFCICCNTAVFSYLLLWNFAWEIGTQLAKNDPLTQTRCLTTVLHPSLSRGYITVRAIYQTYGHQTMQLSLFLVSLLITPLFFVVVVVVAFFCLAKLIFCCLFPVAVNLHLLDAKNYSIWL